MRGDISAKVGRRYKEVSLQAEEGEGGEREMGEEKLGKKIAVRKVASLGNRTTTLHVFSSIFKTERFFICTSRDF